MSLPALLLVGCGAHPADDPVDRASGSTPLPSTDGWQPIAESPLGGRANAVAVWTGEELVVAGGEAQPVCPPAADCASAGRSSNAAAAYDPETDTWRELPPAPRAFASGLGVWLGSRALFVTSRSATFLLDPANGVWSRGPRVPGYVDGGGLVPAGDDVVRFSYSSRGDGPTDHRFDTATGTWVTLPADPFGESYDRSMAWLDGRLWLLSMDVEHHFDAHEGSPSRLAVLEDGHWRVVDAETPDMTQQQWLVPQGDLLVAAENRDPAARNWAYDPTADTWHELASGEPGNGECRLGAASAGPSWITAGDRLVSSQPADALEVPSCPGHEYYHLVAWAGDRLILWGGVPSVTSSEPTGDGLVWVPRQPR
ncbi:hypothetical protein ACFQ0K_10055 [Nocardioides caeni]|uniref:hypothetical protein n=1 Tax=Nocardioides caeni TaxID=574700 RepID=UPI0013051755|nr:hypothetical protein [Nocardioides caeni]